MSKDKQGLDNTQFKVNATLMLMLIFIMTAIKLMRKIFYYFYCNNNFYVKKKKDNNNTSKEIKEIWWEEGGDETKEKLRSRFFFYLPFYCFWLQLLFFNCKMLLLLSIRPSRLNKVNQSQVFETKQFEKHKKMKWNIRKFIKKKKKNKV